MDQSQPRSTRKSSRLLLANAVTAVLLFFFAMPILFLLYGGAAGAIGGLAVIGLFSILQLPIFLLLMRFGVLPQPQTKEPDPPALSPGICSGPPCGKAPSSQSTPH